MESRRVIALQQHLMASLEEEGHNEGYDRDCSDKEGWTGGYAAVDKIQRIMFLKSNYVFL